MKMDNTKQGRYYQENRHSSLLAFKEIIQLP